VLWLDRDLDPLLALSSAGVLPLATGGQLRRGASRAECWTGPVGWLAGARDAPLVGLRWDGRAVSVEPVVDAIAADSPDAQAVRRVLARHAGSRHRRSTPYDTWPQMSAPPWSCTS
jgi:hypothetical protein